MKFPKKIDVFGEDYKIKYKKKVMLEGVEVLGLCNFQNRIIEVSNKQNKNEIFITLLHECLHAVFYELYLNESLEIQHEEIIVNNVSKFVLKIMQKITKINK